MYGRVLGSNPLGRVVGKPYMWRLPSPDNSHYRKQSTSTDELAAVNGNYRDIQITPGNGNLDHL